MGTLITVVHILACVFLVAAVLVQSGKGAEISASFGGSSQTVFGTSGGANFLVKFTQGAAAVFMVTSILLTILSSQSRKSLFEAPGAAPAAPIQTAPLNPGAAPAKPAAPAAVPAQPGAAAQSAAPAQQSAPAAAPAAQPAQAPAQPANHR